MRSCAFSVSKVHWILREARVPPAGTYTDEGSQRVARGSVTLPSGVCWSSKIEVAMTGNDSALLTVYRQALEPSLVPDEAALVVPIGEIDALLELLAGVFAQARRDGVMSARE